jgi:hypothetical protein
LRVGEEGGPPTTSTSPTRGDQGFGSRVLGFSFGSEVSGLNAPSPTGGDQGFGSRISGFSFWGSGLKSESTMAHSKRWLNWFLVSGFGVRVSGFGSRISSLESQTMAHGGDQSFGSRVSGFIFRVSGLKSQVSTHHRPREGIKVSGPGFRVSVFGCRVSGLGSRFLGLGSRV